jgi:hypothetical protein
MSVLTKGRNFQLWEYHVSHGSLLIRSPAGPGIETRVDIICMGVEYLAAPRHLGEITVCPATEAEVEHLEKVLQKKLSPLHVWVFANAPLRSSQIAQHRARQRPGQKEDGRTHAEMARASKPPSVGVVMSRY